jgi:hypothetical protein
MSPLGAKAAALAAIVILILGTVWFIYHKGESAGSATVSNAVHQETIKQIDTARKSKARTDEQVRNTPYHELVDGL